MTSEEIFEYVDAEPFRPFRIQMASGRTFDVRHPEMIRVGLHSIHVFQRSERDPRLYKRAVPIGQSLIESIELLDVPVVQDRM